MPETTITNRKFAQDTRAAKKAASKGPVVITERGRPSHVLLSYEAYRRLRKDEPTIIDLLGMSDAEDISFDPPKLDLKLKPVDFDWCFYSTQMPCPSCEKSDQIVPTQVW